MFQRSSILFLILWSKRNCNFQQDYFEFKYAFKVDISFGKDDLIIPRTKENLINNTKKQIEEYEKQYTWFNFRGEKYDKEDVWSKCTDTVANEMMKEISSAEKVYIDKLKLTRFI